MTTQDTDALKAALEQRLKESYARVVISTDETRAIIAALEAAAPLSQPVMAVDRNAVLEEAADHCVAAAYALGAVDGYDYRSGQEDGLRQAERLIRKLAAAPPASAPARDAMLERVRDVLIKLHGPAFGPPEHLERIAENRKIFCEKLARAAIKAMTGRE